MNHLKKQTTPETDGARVLVTGASGVIGYGILKSLRAAGCNYFLIGTSIHRDSVAPAFCDVFEPAPPTTDPVYFDWLETVCRRHRVDLIIPGIEIDVFAFNEQRDRLAGAGLKVLLNTSGLINLCRDKWEFFQVIQESPLAIPTRISGSFEELADHFGRPFILKPRRGSASKGLEYIHSAQDFNLYSAEFGANLMAQPVTGSPDQEYTVAGFFDEANHLTATITLRRTLSAEGFTEKAHPAELPGLSEALSFLAAKLHPVGPTNFQFRRENGQLKLLEVNPRISSATSVRTAFGYNEAEMSVRFALAGEVPLQPEIRPGLAIRYAEEKIFYDRFDF